MAKAVIIHNPDGDLLSCTVVNDDEIEEFATKVRKLYSDAVIDEHMIETQESVLEYFRENNDDA
jgi:23S rRNA maturation-related 3'-5' exoribonuclease YhaM